MMMWSMMIMDMDDGWTWWIIELIVRGQKEPGVKAKVCSIGFPFGDQGT